MELASAPLEIVEEGLHCVDGMKKLESIYKESVYLFPEVRMVQHITLDVKKESWRRETYDRNPPSPW